MKLLEAKDKLSIDEKHLKELEVFKERVIDSVKHLEDLKKQYSLAVKGKLVTGPHLIELKRKLDIAKVEFRYNIQAFNAMLNSRQFA